MKNSNLIFKPFIAEKYGESEYGKILILGESHYGQDDNLHEDFTIDVLTDVLDGDTSSSYRIYTNIGLLYDESDKSEVWRFCAFSNLIQGLLSDQDDQPKDEHLSTVIPAFWEILDITKPDKIIVCSKRAWETWMPDNDSRCRKIDMIEEEGKSSTIWEYDYEGGNCVAIGINHPTSIGFSHNQWRPIFQKFLNYRP